MKSVLFTVLCIFGLVTPRAVALDVVDDLLGGPSATASSETVSDASTHARSAPWQVTPSVIGSDLSSSGAIPAHSPDHKSAPFNAVPEPTAMVLALLALIYFLVFGRRRRVV
jgi:hypothetical protein